MLQTPISPKTAAMILLGFVIGAITSAAFGGTSNLAIAGTNIPCPLASPFDLAASPANQVDESMYLNSDNKAVLDFTPHYWTPFHQYMENIRDCKSCPLVHKWEPYFKGYDTHLSRFRGKNVTMVEVGVQSGGSMMMWRSYFGPGLRYYGIDIDPAAQQFESEWATIFIGDQGDPAFWASVKNKILPVDFFLDDGGHTMKQQITTFRLMFPQVKLDGVYACEDLATSYSPKFGGVKQQPGALEGPRGSFIELSKQMIDWMNCYFVNGNVMASRKCSAEFDKIPGATNFIQTGYSLHFYSQILFIEKAKVVPPRHYKAGAYSFECGGPSTVWNGKHYDTPTIATASIVI